MITIANDFDNLTQVNLPNNDVISYTYDARNRMISKTVNGTVEYRLIYAGQLSPIAKVDATGAVLETYVYGLGVNSPDYIIKNGTEYQVIKDHLGSMRMIVDTTTGTIEKSISYDEFGNITSETGTLNTIFGYAGGIRDTDTGLTKFGARWYDPVTGRWLEKEPLGFKGSDNFYSYCDGDPVNHVDLNGLEYGDVFSTPIEALLDALNSANPRSIIENLEYQGFIIQIGSNLYISTDPYMGYPKHCDLLNLPSDAVIWWHTHGAKEDGFSSEKFSPDDFDVLTFYEYNVVGYLGTPEGRIIRHDGEEVQGPSDYGLENGGQY